jgi:uncharacterized protein (DUF1697 family)
MAKHVALLRGINVGTAKSIAMSELATVFTGLGFSNVKTVLRSGNVVFESGGPLAESAGADIERAIFDATAVRSNVLVIGAPEFVAVADANPLFDVATDGSKLFVTFVTEMPASLVVPDAAAIAPEILAIGPAAVYQWMPAGSMQTKVTRAFWGQFERPVTARNANTVEKLRALLDG